MTLAAAALAAGCVGRGVWSVDFFAGLDGTGPADDQLLVR